MAGSVTVRDRGAARILREIGTKGQGPFVDVGIVGANAEKSKGDGITVADVATWAEFGLGQPKRSWLREWVDQNEAKIQDRISKEIRAVLQGKRTREQALARIGVWCVGEIQKRIANQIPPPNAESTIEKKGSSVPLIDKGQFRSSITSRVGKG